MTEKQLVIKQLHKKVAPFARKIAPVYKALNWKWSGSGRSEFIVPDAVDIAISLTGMIEQLEKSGYKYVSTGGLAVEIKEDPEDCSCSIGRIEFKIDEEVYEDEDEL